MDSEPDAGVKELPNSGFDVAATAERDPKPVIQVTNPKKHTPPKRGGGRSAVDHELRTAAANGRFEDEGWLVRKDASLFWANVIIIPLWQY